jgi:hypothetical protein
MTLTQIAVLKQTLDQATEAYNAEQARLAAAGLKSKERYGALRPLKAAQDAANSAYVAAAHRAVRAELSKIIAADALVRRAEKLARSPWRQAKSATKAASKAASNAE